MKKQDINTDIPGDSLLVCNTLFIVGASGGGGGGAALSVSDRPQGNRELLG